MKRTKYNIIISRDGEETEKPVYITSSGKYVVKFRNDPIDVTDNRENFFINGKTAQAKYDKTHTTGVYLKLNKKTDADIIEKLESVDNRQGYLKRLIKEDIMR